MDDLKKNFIIDVNENEFAEKIIEQSANKLILVDFWAPWCGPCKQLTPILEKITNESKGAFILAKVNIDENQQIASQLNIQSIPAVFAFKAGGVADAFQGVLPEEKIVAFIEKNLGEKIKKDFSNFHNEIKKLFDQKKFNEARDLVEGHLVENSDDIEGIGYLLDCFISLNLYDDASNFIESLDEILLSNPIIKPLIQKLEIKKK